MVNLRERERGKIWFRVCSAIGGGGTRAVMFGERGREREEVRFCVTLLLLSYRQEATQKGREKGGGGERRRQSLVRPGLQVAQDYNATLFLVYYNI